jgi:ferrous iron transport protein B
VLFSLYVAGIVSAFAVAFVLTRTTRAPAAPLLMELPSYHWPSARHLGLGLLERARVFLRRVGTTILALMVVLWGLSSFPAPPADAAGPAIQYSLAGQLGAVLAHVLEPLGFNWQISIALVSGLAAREVAVGALATVYSMAAGGEAAGEALVPVLATQWSLATGLAMLAWYVFAPQCLSTLAAVRRETGSWRTPALMAAYLFALAYVAAFLTYRAALALGA